MELKPETIYWVAVNDRLKRTTEIVDHPDKVWALTGHDHESIARGWKLQKVDRNGSPITMIGCTGGCGDTLPKWRFDITYNSDLREEYTCKHCGGRGEAEPINFSEELYDQFNNASDAYKAAEKEMKAAELAMQQLCDEINDMWNFTHSVEDLII